MNDLFDENEMFDERAGVLEFDGKLDRKEAEAAAAKEVEKHKFMCIIRQLCKWRSEGQGRLGREWIEAQPTEERERYRDEANRQFDNGNNGEWGKWYA